MLKPQRLLALNEGINFRELGGYATTDHRHIRWHKLLRAGELHFLTQQDINDLVAYGVRYDVDLRSDSEIMAMHDPYISNCTYVQASVFPFDCDQNTAIWDKIKEYVREYHQASEHHTHLTSLDETYIKMVTDPHALQAYQKLFATLLANTADDSALVFHCTAGKDRTGVGAILIEQALGLPMATIKEDYLLTNVILSNSLDDINKLRQEVNDNNNVGNLVNQLNSESIGQLTFDIIINTILDGWHSWQNYFTKALHLSTHDLADLKKIYLQ